MKNQDKTQTSDGYWSRSLRQRSENTGRMIDTKVVGVSYDGRQRVVEKLRVGEEILLRREPSNPYDRNAIRVERLDGAQIGYLNRFLAANLAPSFDSHNKPIPAGVTNLLGTSSAGHNIGVEIRFVVPEL